MHENVFRSMPARVIKNDLSAEEILLQLPENLEINEDSVHFKNDAKIKTLNVNELALDKTPFSGLKLSNEEVYSDIFRSTAIDAKAGLIYTNAHLCSSLSVLGWLFCRANAATATIVLSSANIKGIGDYSKVVLTADFEEYLSKHSHCVIALRDTRASYLDLKYFSNIKDISLQGSTAAITQTLYIILGGM